MGFGPPVTPPVIKQLLIANFAVYVLQLMGFIGYGFAASPAAFWTRGYLWQPFTYMFLHSPVHIGHILVNMLMLWMFGSQLALVWGSRRFLRYYLTCGVGAGLFIVTYPWILHYLGQPQALSIPTVGASGAVYGVLLAYSLTWPDRTIMLIFPPVAFRAIWLIPINFGLNVLFGGGAVSHIGHLGGVVVGWLILRAGGQTEGFSLEKLKYKWRRYRMRKRLRAVQLEELRERERDTRNRSNRDRWMH